MEVGTTEKKKEYLRGYLYCKRREVLLEEQIAELRERKMSPCSYIDGMLRAKGNNDLSEYIAKLDELIYRLDEERLLAVRKYEEIYMQVEKVQNPVLKEVLTRHYLLGEVWEDIAFRMNYSNRHILRIHGEALKEFRLPEKREVE